MAKPSTSEEVPSAFPYSEAYIEICFQVWYKNNRLGPAPKLLKLVPEDEHGRKPHPVVFRNWRHEYSWDARADVLDARASGIVDDDLVALKVQMLRDQAAKGKVLQQLGMDYLVANGFDTASAAVQAVIRGANLERTSRGLSDALVKIAQMDNDKLAGEFQKLLEKASDSGKIIDVGEKQDGSEESDE